MELPEKLHLNILHKIHGRADDTESSSSSSLSSLSDSETEVIDINETPRSLGSENSSIVASPRASLLWDHGFDVLEQDHGAKAPDQRELEWKLFNKTDDDKLKADKKAAAFNENRLKIQEIADRIQKLNDMETREPNEITMESPRSLPDLISSMSSAFNNSVESPSPPPLPDSDPPMIDLTDHPPPLPSTSPPTIYQASAFGSQDNEYSLSPDISTTTGDSEWVSEMYQISLPSGAKAITFSEVTDGKRHVSERKTPHTEQEECDYSIDTDDTIKPAIDLRKLKDEETFDKKYTQCEDFEGTENTARVVDMGTDYITHDNAKIQTNKPNNVTKNAEPKFESIIQSLNLTHTQELSPEQMEDVEAEFESILQLLDLAHSHETYEDRFSGRRDKYGFILSPIGEAPSPTPSSLSGYSGISCASPDPFSNFRMSPSPRGSSPDPLCTFRMSPIPKGLRSDLDLSSLTTIVSDINTDQDQTVPIYKSVQAKKVYVVPEGFGWDSEDDLLSSIGSGEWDQFHNGLSSPPVSTTSVNLTQFGTHISGWKHPDKVIYEEPEVLSASDDSGDTLEGEEFGSKGVMSDYDTDDTIDDDSPRIVIKDAQVEDSLEAEGDPTEYTSNESERDDSIQELELSILEEGIQQVEHELISLASQCGNEHNYDNNQMTPEYSSVTVSNLNETNDSTLSEQDSNDPTSSETERVVKQYNTSNNVNTDRTENKEHESSDTELNDTIDSIDIETEIIQSASFKITTNDSFQEINNEVADIITRNSETVTAFSDTDTIKKTLGQIYEAHIDNVQKQRYTSDDETDSSDSNEDAEDEYSDSDDDETEFMNLRTTLERENQDTNDKQNQNQEQPSVKELMSPRTAKLLLGSMFPGEIDSSYTSSENDDDDDYDDDNADESELDPNMSSYGSGVRVTQYTSDDSDTRSENKLEPNRRQKLVSFRKESDISPGEIRISQYENDSAANTPSFQIQSPLDFSIFGSKLDMTNKAGGTRSPRVFGRYYAEMDSSVIEEVSKPVHDIRAVYAEHSPDAVEKPMYQVDDPDEESLHNLENSFKNIIFLKQNGNTEASTCSDNPMQQFVESNISKNFENGCYHPKTMHSDTTPEDKTDSNEHKSRISVLNGKHMQIHINEANVADTSCEKHEYVNKKSKWLHHKDVKSQQTPVKINVSHLARQGSTRHKIKRGFVHQLSEIFSQKNSQENAKCEIKNKKTTRDVDRSVQIKKSELLIAKDNIVIEEHIGDVKGLDTLDDTGHNAESLGFEVSPFQKVDTFDEKTQYNGTKDTNADGYEDDFESDNCDNGPVNQNDYELSLYEEQLRQLDNDTHYSELGSTYSGTGEFKPHDAAIDNTTDTTDEEEEIEEHITGDYNSDQSEDAELLEKIHACDHSSYEKGQSAGKVTYREDVGDKHTPGDYSDDESTYEQSKSEIYAHLEENTHISDHEKTRPYRKIGGTSSGELSQSYITVSEIDHNLNEHNNTETENTDQKTGQLTKERVSKSLNQPIDLSTSVWRPNPARSRNASSAGKEAGTSKSCFNVEEKNNLSVYDVFSLIKYPSTLKHKTNVSYENVIKDATTNNLKALWPASDPKNTNTEVDCFVPADSPRGEVRSLKQIDRYDKGDVFASGGSYESDTIPKYRYKLDQQYDSDDRIRYPASLSRRLYGPYLRRKGENLKKIETDIDVQLTRNNSGRGVTTPGLSHIKDEARLHINRSESSEFVRTWMETNEKDNTQTHKSDEDSCTMSHIIHKHDENNTHVANVHPKDVHGMRHQTEIQNNVMTEISASPLFLENRYDNESNFEHLSDNSIEGIEGNIVNPYIFQHTCYDVQVPFSHLAQRESIKFNSKQITVKFKSSEAQREKDSENLFVNANQRLEAVHTDARNDKHLFDFSKSACLSTGKATNLPVKTNSDICIVERISSSVEKGGGSLQTAVKNDLYHKGLGVHIPREIASTGATHQNVNMQNDTRSSLPRINGSTFSTTHTINQSRMSAGDVHLTGSGRTDENMTLPEADTDDELSSVVTQTADYQHVLEDEKGHLKLWPYSDFENSDKVPVTLHKARKRINLVPRQGMGKSENSSSMTVIQNAQHSAEMPENRMVQRYHSSAVIPLEEGTGQLMKTHGDSVQTALLNDGIGYNITEEDLAAVLPRIANSVANMKQVDAEEILPGITQSITQLKNGGNLVITTMTRKIDEIESDDSSGRGSTEPTHPVLNVDDLENSNIYLVQDSKGELFYVEDITSDSQESAYFSSSRNTSESVSDGGHSPMSQRISKIRQVGTSGIHDSTAEEILSSMYTHGDGVQEITENEEEWSERTYQYDQPPRSDAGPGAGSRRDYSKEAFNTSYMVEEPETLPKSKTTTRDRYETSYEVSEGAPWVYDGGIAQSYSQATQGAVNDEMESVSAMSNADDFKMRARNVVQTSQATATGYTKSSEAYTMEAEAQLFPVVPYTSQTIYATPPAPYVYPPAPMCVQTSTPQYSLVKVDVTPTTAESVTTKVHVSEHNNNIDEVDRPIYKTVAHIKTGEKQPSVQSEMTEKKKYKILASKASSTKEEEEVQESHMSFSEMDYRYSAENVEYKMSPTVQRKQFCVRNSTNIEPPTTRFRTEKQVELNNNVPHQKYKTEIQVQDTTDHNTHTTEENSYSYSQMKANMEQSDSNMRVVRGSYLIKNNLEEVDVALDDNINMFDGNFTLRKDNPLYQSDEDLYRRLEREKVENARKQQRFQRDLNQDITFETVDKFSKSKTVQREEKPKLSLNEILMSRLSTIDSKDIRQHIDVKHHSEDIYGDPRFMHADGSSSLQSSSGTSDFDSVGEKVDLLLKEGKAYITVKVTAERITPIDLEFNVWRKNQAIVTRTIEVDLLATEQRRRLYYKVMDEPGRGARAGYMAGSNETVLDSHQTLDLFTRILGAADGEGDKEDITVKTRSSNTTRPFTSGMDLLY